MVVNKEEKNRDEIRNNRDKPQQQLIIRTIKPKFTGIITKHSKGFTSAQNVDSEKVIRQSFRPISIKKRRTFHNEIRKSIQIVYHNRYQSSTSFEREAFIALLKIKEKTLRRLIKVRITVSSRRIIKKVQQLTQPFIKTGNYFPYIETATSDYRGKDQGFKCSRPEIPNKPNIRHNMRRTPYIIHRTCPYRTDCIFLRIFVRPVCLIS